MRLDRILSNSGCGTRSQIKDLIRAGAVSVDGRVINDPSLHITADQFESIIFRGSRLFYSQFIYLCLNKPDACLTALQDSRLPTVRQYIPENLCGKGISPVGRLDYHTTGVLLLTNDGELNHRLTSPKYHIPKSYTIGYSGPPIDQSDVDCFAEGFVLSDRPGEETSLAPAKLIPIDDQHCVLTIIEGRTHQVKRMLAAIGRPVQTLHRNEFGGIVLPPTQMPGDIRDLSSEEIQSLRTSCDIHYDPGGNNKDLSQNETDLV